MDNPNITMEEYIRLEEEKSRRRAIVFNDTLTSEAALSCEPTEMDIRDKRTKNKAKNDITEHGMEELEKVKVKSQSQKSKSKTTPTKSKVKAGAAH
ncbi:hypothetical protein Tco_0104819 [Tanacetum coccineum]